MKKKEYSGPLLWLSLASFLMPVAVAVWAFRDLPQPYTYPEIKPDVSGVDQQLWDHLLHTYVADGLIDYDGLKRTHLFKTYITQLANADPTKLPSDAHRLAFLTNAYNAFVINGVLVHRVKENILTEVVDQAGKKGVFFGLTEHVLAGETLSLDQLEKKRILPVYNDPRLHMALVCAARSCPSMRPEAYTGERIDAQLEDQAKLFANSPAQVRYDAEKKQLHVSRLLMWYSNDFRGQEGYLDFLAQRTTDKMLLKGIAAVRSGDAEVTFNEYNWTLNTQGKAVAPTGNTNFGSGSIPNE